MAWRSTGGVPGKRDLRTFVNACDNHSLSVMCYAAPYAVMPFLVVVRGCTVPRHGELTAYDVIVLQLKTDVDALSIT